MPDEHALLSASGSHIWLNCTVSPYLSKDLPDTDTDYTREGTLAHAIAETKLNALNGKGDSHKRELDRLKANPLYRPEMDEYTDEYAAYVTEEWNAAKTEDPNAILFTEQRLDFSPWVPKGFGTGDTVIIADDTITVIDLKYGKGVPVNAVNNPQLRLYALGAYNDYSFMGNFKRVRMLIIQPRLDNVSVDEMSVPDLLEWGEHTVKPKSALAINGDGEAKAGDWCKFCKVKPICRARAEEALRIARKDFADPLLLEEDEITEFLAIADRVESWCKELKEYAFNEALNGRKWSGYKLVEGRAVRKITNERELVTRLKEKGFDEALLYERKLLSLTQLEKVAGKKVFAEVSAGVVEKPQGKPTLVPESDKRPEYVKNGFNDFDD